MIKIADALDAFVQAHELHFPDGRPSGSLLPTGWYQLADAAFRELRALAEQSGHVPSSCECRLIAEKFGELRLTVSVPTELDEAAEVIVIRAEERSRSTCMVCGLAGSITCHGWLRALCVHHEAIACRAAVH